MKDNQSGIFKTTHQFPHPVQHLCQNRNVCFYSRARPLSLINQGGKTQRGTPHTFAAKSIKQFHPSPPQSRVSLWLSGKAFIFLLFANKMLWASGLNVEHNIDGCSGHWPLGCHVVGAGGSLELAEEIYNIVLEAAKENGLLCLFSMWAKDRLKVWTGCSMKHGRRRKRERMLAVGGCGPGSRSFRSAAGFWSGCLPHIIQSALINLWLLFFHAELSLSSTELMSFNRMAWPHSDSLHYEEKSIQTVRCALEWTEMVLVRSTSANFSTN